MIVYYLGIPGSGKSYSGVNTIYDNFTDNKDAKKDLKKGYNNCYTNINEFKFDLCHDVFNLDFDELYKHLTFLYDMYKAKKSDDELIEKAKEFNIYKTLFVIDECHNFFDTADKVKIWWLTYHRHLYHDIILITQNLALVNSKYKPLAEAFFKAKSSSLTLNKQYFNYMYYTDSRMTSASYVNTVKVKKRQSVFKLYQSGDSVKSKNVILRFIYISLFFVALLIAFIYYFFSSKESEIKKEDPKIETSRASSTSPPDNRQSKKIDNDIDEFSDKVFLTVKCSFSSCSTDSFSLPPKLFNKFILMEYIHSFYNENINKHLVIYYVSMNKDFYTFISKKEIKNNETLSLTSSGSLFGNGN